MIKKIFCLFLCSVITLTMHIPAFADAEAVNVALGKASYNVNYGGTSWKTSPETANKQTYLTDGDTSDETKVAGWGPATVTGFAFVDLGTTYQINKVTGYAQYESGSMGREVYLSNLKPNPTVEEAKEYTGKTNAAEAIEAYYKLFNQNTADSNIKYVGNLKSQTEGKTGEFSFETDNTGSYRYVIVRYEHTNAAGDLYELRAFSDVKSGEEDVVQNVALGKPSYNVNYGGTSWKTSPETANKQTYLTDGDTTDGTKVAGWGPATVTGFAFVDLGTAYEINKVTGYAQYERGSTGREVYLSNLKPNPTTEEAKEYTGKTDDAEAIEAYYKLFAQDTADSNIKYVGNLKSQTEGKTGEFSFETDNTGSYRYVIVRYEHTNAAGDLYELRAFSHGIVDDDGEDGDDVTDDGEDGDDVTDDNLNMTEVSNIAPNKPAFSLSSDLDTDPRMAVDGDIETFWQSKNYKDNSEQLIIDLGDSYSIKGIGILPAFSGSADNITVYGTNNALYKDKTKLLDVEAIDTDEMYIDKVSDMTARYIIFERPAAAEDNAFALSEIAVYVPNDEAESSVSEGSVSLLTLNKTTYMSNLADSYHNASKYNASKLAGFNDDDPTTLSGDATSEQTPIRIITDMGIPMKLSHVGVQVKDGTDYGNAFKIVATDSYSSAKDNFSISHYDVIAEVDTLNRDSKNDSGLIVIEVPDEYKDNEYQFVGVIKEHATTITGASNNYNRLSINTLQAYALSSDVSDYVSESGNDYILSDISATVSDSELTINTRLLNGENADKLVSVFMRNTDRGKEVIFAESTAAHAGAYNNLTITAPVVSGTEGTWEAALIKGRTIIKYYENLRKQTEREPYSGDNNSKISYNQIGSSINVALEADCSVMAMIILNPGANPESFGVDDIFAYSLAKSPEESNGVWTHTFDYTMPSDAPEGEYGVVFVTDNPMSALAKTSYVFDNPDVSDITDTFANVTANSFAELVEANKGFFGTIADELLASDTMGQSFMLAKEGFEKGIFDKTLTNWSDVNTITAAAKAALVIDGAFMGNDIDITPYIGSMPDVFTDSYDADEFMGILSSVQKSIPKTADEAATAISRASALCLVANGSVEGIQYALTNYSEKLGISKSTLNTKYSMLDIAGKLSNDMEVVKSRYADGMDSEVSVALTQLKSEDTVDSEEKGHSQGGKKGISIGAGSSVAPLPPVSDSVIQPELVSGFWDIVDYDWAKEAIAILSQRGIISGKGSGIFDPAGKLTREETVKLLILAMNLTTDGLGENNYSDCSVGQWYYPFVTAAKVNELVYGISKQEFGLGLNVTRQDLAVMLYRALCKRGIEYEGDAVTFTDSFAVSEYAKEAVNTLAGLGIVTGYADGSFSPGDSATRAEAAVIFHRFLNVIEAEK